MITYQQTKQLMHWFNNPVDFINDCIFFEHPVYDSVKITLNDKQTNMINQIHNNKNILVTGKRQKGVSLTLLAYTLWYNLFNTNHKTMMTSDTFTNTIDRMHVFDYMYDHLPDWIKQLNPISNSKREKIFTGSSNKLLIMPYESNCRGMSMDMIVVDNAQYCKNLNNSIREIYPTLHSTSGKIILASTCEQPFACDFNDMVVDQIEGRNAWTLVEMY